MSELRNNLKEHLREVPKRVRSSEVTLPDPDLFDKRDPNDARSPSYRQLKQWAGVALKKLSGDLSHNNVAQAKEILKKMIK